jgi:fibronectin type 3 domain-containing protein
LITEQGYADNSVSVGHTYYYAVTSEELSGLESDYLSNILRVNISSGSTNWDNYRGEGQKGWDTTPPGSISSLSVSILSAGVYQLTWQGPPDQDVRYYNVYYSIAGPPTCIQQRLIASPGRMSTKFIDWQANSGYSPFYGVTAVDRAGNESLPRYFPSGDSDTTPPGAIRDLR